MNRPMAWSGVVLLTLLTYLQFPGHTWLQSDTQIYVPMLEHQRDPSVLEKDLVVHSPHLAYLLYDEVTLGLSRATGWTIRQTLATQQLTTRALGVSGVFLLASGAGLAVVPSLWVSATYGLGARIQGPAVNSVESEPVPRGFAVGLIFFAVGLLTRGRLRAAGVAAAVALVYHPPTALPFCALFACSCLWPVRERDWWGLVPLVAAALLVLASSRGQAGEAQALFARLDAQTAALQRMRASYSWVSMWWGQRWLHFTALFAFTLAAVWKAWPMFAPRTRWVLTALPIWGMVSVAVSFYLLEVSMLGIVPQFQPARALLFVSSLAPILGAISAYRAAEQRRWLESGAWLLPVYLVPMTGQVFDALPVPRLVALVVLVTGGAAALWFHQNRAGSMALAAVAVAAFFVVPGVGAARSGPGLHSAELNDLARWAHSGTPPDAVFLFPDDGRQLDAGVFRAESLRAIYVDWKGGAMVNIFRDFALEWWTRWQATMEGGFRPELMPRYSALGVDYVVLRGAHEPAGHSPVFRNSRYAVYRVEPR